MSLMEALAVLVASAGRPQNIDHVRVVEEPKHTVNHFGPMTEIAGKRLRVMEMSDQGCCLCLHTGEGGQYLVDVDSRDIERHERVVVNRG